jgi:hypothetical protein
VSFSVIWSKFSQYLPSPIEPHSTLHQLGWFSNKNEQSQTFSVPPLWIFSILAVSILGAAANAAIRFAGQRRTQAKPKRVASAADRGRDNRNQACIILIVVILSATIGIFMSLRNQETGIHWIGGAFLGTIGGLVIGLVASGTIIMAIRYVRSRKSAV